MKLVEVVQAEKTDAIVVETMVAICKQMNKVPVICKDAPGFIVNRVARHYYLEAMNLVEQGNATIENVDELMEATGFKMGPFMLMDYIGNDINYAVTESVFSSFYFDPRFKPSFTQKRHGDRKKIELSFLYRVFMCTHWIHLGSRLSVQQKLME